MRATMSNWVVCLCKRGQTVSSLHTNLMLLFAGASEYVNARSFTEYRLEAHSQRFPSCPEVTINMFTLCIKFFPSARMCLCGVM